MKLTLTESQLNRLIGEYKQLNEQVEGFNQQTVTKSIDLGATFDSGKYLLSSSIQSDVKKRLKPLVDFLITNPSSDVKITIVAGESRVTNYDREKCGPGIYTAECKLKPKQLSLLRAQQIEVYLNKLFVNLKSNGTIPKLPPKPTISTVLGSTKYTSGVDNPEDPKYKKEQKIELLIDAEASYECLVGMKITISFEGKGGHNCDEAIFDVQLNNQSLGVANLNNGAKDTMNMEAMLERSGKVLKSKIRLYNRALITKHNPEAIAIKRELRLYGPKRNGKLFSEYKLKNGKTMESLGFDFKSYDKMYNSKKGSKLMGVLRREVGSMHGTIEFSDEIIVDEALVKKLEPYFKFPESAIGKPITQVTTSGQDLSVKLRSIAGRETDKKQGGVRRQTFELDQAKAKSIVTSGDIKNRLILSITPLVGKTGPYKTFYKAGSHSDVPTVKIINGDGETLYKGNPNVNMTRGSMEKTILLQTDLCGKPLKR